VYFVRTYRYAVSVSKSSSLQLSPNYGQFSTSAAGFSYAPAYFEHSNRKSRRYFHARIILAVSVASFHAEIVSICRISPYRFMAFRQRRRYNRIRYIESACRANRVNNRGIRRRFGESSYVMNGNRSVTNSIGN